MDAKIFWDVIGNYNSNTVFIQLILLIALIFSFIISIIRKKGHLINISLGISNLYIGIAFFYIYGTEPIQKYFAFPLFLLIGFIFIFEGLKKGNNDLVKPNIIQLVIFLLFLIYPLVSILLGHKFPKLVLYIMPCPIVTLSIASYSLLKNKNLILLILLCIWGLTGIKSLIFNVYEDIILLLTSFYCIFEIIKAIRNRKVNNKNIIV